MSLKVVKTSRSRFIKSSDQDDNDEDFDKFKITFDSVYNMFVSDRSRVDVFDGMNRSEFRTKASKLPDELMKQKLLQLKQKQKDVETNNLTVPIDDPFEILGFDVKTPVQEKVVQHSNWMKYYGNYAYCCSCGAGKTLAGIYLIYKFQCRTLIISSRNAVNDQWFSLLYNIYPKIIIQTKNGWYYQHKKLNKHEIDDLTAEGFEPDIMIYSPQYLGKYVDNYHLTAGLIIYDEVHSLLSNEFIKVLLLPLYKVIDGSIDELPYMIALSATYPTDATIQGKESIKRLNKLFGSVFRINSEVRRIPVMVWDYRDHYTKTDRKTGEVLKGNDALGSFDSKYIPLDDYEAIDYFCCKIRDEKHIKICPEYKGIIMTYSIDSSVYAALRAHQLFNCSVIIIRTAEESSFLLEKDKNLDFEFDESVKLDVFTKGLIGVKVNDYKDVVNECAIITGTIHRLKEGFSVRFFVTL